MVGNYSGGSFSLSQDILQGSSTGSYNNNENAQEGPSGGGTSDSRAASGGQTSSYYQSGQVSAGVYSNVSYSWSSNESDTTTTGSSAPCYSTGDTWTDTNQITVSGSSSSGTDVGSSGSSYSWMQNPNNSGATYGAGASSWQTTTSATLPTGAVPMSPDATTIPEAGAEQSVGMAPVSASPNLSLVSAVGSWESVVGQYSTQATNNGVNYASGESWPGAANAESPPGGSIESHMLYVPGQPLVTVSLLPYDPSAPSPTVQLLPHNPSAESPTMQLFGGGTNQQPVGRLVPNQAGPQSGPVQNKRRPRGKGTWYWYGQGNIWYYYVPGQGGAWAFLGNVGNGATQWEFHDKSTDLFFTIIVDKNGKPGKWQVWDEKNKQWLFITEVGYQPPPGVPIGPGLNDTDGSKWNTMQGGPGGKPWVITPPGFIPPPPVPPNDLRPPKFKPPPSDSWIRPKHITGQSLLPPRKGKREGEGKGEGEGGESHPWDLQFHPLPIFQGPIFGGIIQMQPQIGLGVDEDGSVKVIPGIGLFWGSFGRK